MRFAKVLAIVLMVSLMCGTASGRTWHVPDDAPTIQAGIDSAAAGDTVMVECGTYYETYIWVQESGIFITSETGLPDCVTIDGQQQHRLFSVNNVDSTTVIKGFTLANGWQTTGGAININSSTIRLLNCNMINNSADTHGGAIILNTNAAPRFVNCLIADNTCLADGGGIASYRSEPVFRNCTFAGNSADRGGNIYIAPGGYQPVIMNTIIASAGAGGGIHCLGSATSITHCCIFGNAGGDSLCGNYYQNLFVDPLFCYAENPAEPYAVYAQSPCVPENNPWGEWIGAYESGCPSPAVPVGWGNVKKMFE